jgi:hypothetical protein
MHTIDYGGFRVETDGHPADTRNALRYIVAAHAAEPLFVVRGRDLFAPDALGYYAALCRSHRVPSRRVAMETQVLQHRERFLEWQESHGQALKYPDAYPGWPGV